MAISVDHYECKDVGSTTQKAWRADNVIIAHWIHVYQMSCCGQQLPVWGRVNTLQLLPAFLFKVGLQPQQVRPMHAELDA